MPNKVKVTNFQISIKSHMILPYLMSVCGKKTKFHLNAHTFDKITQIR